MQSIFLVVHHCFHDYQQRLSIGITIWKFKIGKSLFILFNFIYTFHTWMIDYEYTWRKMYCGCCCRLPSFLTWVHRICKEYIYLLLFLLDDIDFIIMPKYLWCVEPFWNTSLPAAIVKSNQKIWRKEQFLRIQKFVVPNLLARKKEKYDKSSWSCQELLILFLHTSAYWFIFEVQTKELLKLIGLVQLLTSHVTSPQSVGLTGTLHCFLPP